MNNPRIKRYIVGVLSVLFLCIIVSVTTFAQVPKMINYQGYLTDKNTGEPVTKTVQMEFAIYDVPTGGNSLWNETQTVGVKDGNYSVRLGENNPIGLTEAKTYYLGFKIDGELVKDEAGNEYREELTSAMYALFVDGVRLEETTTLIGREVSEKNTGIYNTFIGYRTGNQNTTGYYNTFIGKDAGRENETGVGNTFIGENTGSSNMTGHWNTFIGRSSGAANTASFNTFIGEAAGYKNTIGIKNTFIGHGTGYNNHEGSGNIFIGENAGYNENGSNKLYIANSDTSSPLIYGEFDNQKVQIHGDLTLGYREHKAGKIRLWQEPDEADDKVSHAIGTEPYYTIYGAGTEYEGSVGHKFYRGGGEWAHATVEGLAVKDK